LVLLKVFYYQVDDDEIKSVLLQMAGALRFGATSAVGTTSAILGSLVEKVRLRGDGRAFRLISCVVEIMAESDYRAEARMHAGSVPDTHQSEDGAQDGRVLVALQDSDEDDDYPDSSGFGLLENTFNDEEGMVSLSVVAALNRVAMQVNEQTTSTTNSDGEVDSDDGYLLVEEW